MSYHSSESLRNVDVTKATGDTRDLKGVKVPKGDVCDRRCL